MPKTFLVCKICNNLFTTNKKSAAKYCPDCLDLYAGVVEYIKENHVGKLTNCLICQRPIPMNLTNRYTCSRRSCREIWTAMQHEHNKRLKKGMLVEPHELPAFTKEISKMAEMNDNDYLSAAWLGLEPGDYMNRKLRCNAVDDMTLRARQLGMSYGEYMWKSGANVVFLVEQRMDIHPDKTFKELCEKHWRWFLNRNKEELI